MRAALVLELTEAGRIARHYGPRAARIVAEAAVVVATIAVVTITAIASDTPPRPSIMLAETIR